jgi:hypothetical protein
MKKIILVLLTAFVVTFIHSTLSNEHLVFSNTGGSPGDFANLPGGSNCTTCHIGTAQTISNAILTNIPATGYETGQTYDISVEISSGLTNRFGFQLAVRNNNGDAIGTLISPDNQTNLQSNAQFITHTLSGTSGSNNSKTWNFQWIAPITCYETVNFYASILSSNDDGSDNGDLVYLTSLTGIVSNTVDTAIALGNVNGTTSSVCWGQNTGTMTLLNSVGTVIRWEKRLNGGVWSSITNTNNTYSETPSSVGTW